MDDTPPAFVSPPTHLAAACERLRSEPDIVITQDLARDPGNRAHWRLRCQLHWSSTPPGGFPAQAAVEIVLPETYPFDAPDIILLDEAFRGFPHQSSATGQLCLREERFAPFTEEKLGVYLEWTRAWLRDAATGNLQKAGDHYELPDFRLEAVPPTHEGLPKPRFEFIEDTETFPRWTGKSGARGRLRLGGSEPSRFVPLRYCGGADDDAIETIFATQEHKETAHGYWVFLADLTYVRHRPPLVHGEMAQLCARHGLDYWDILRAAWETPLTKSEVGLLVWGWPVPAVVGGEPVEVHWQPQYFIPFGARQRLAPKGVRKANQLWSIARQCEFSDHALIHWGSSSNISEARCLARSSLQAEWRDRPIALLGCGALGSALAEHLARGGIRDLRLFDKEGLSFGNLARHTLDGRSVGFTKCSSLALRLGSLHPQRKVTGHCAEIPSGVTGQLSTSKEAIALYEADWWINAALDRSGFEWLSREARRRKKRLATLFLSWGAEYLTLLVSGRNTECRRAEQLLLHDIQHGRTPIDPARYLCEPTRGEQILPGVGCWHATFPATGPHVTLLASAAIDLMQHHFAEPFSCDAYAAVLRRTSIPAGAFTSPLPLVEVAWAAHYR